jgi:voltage-gated potassium channel
VANKRKQQKQRQKKASSSIPPTRTRELEHRIPVKQFEPYQLLIFLLGMVPAYVILFVERPPKPGSLSVWEASALAMLYLVFNALTVYMISRAAKNWTSVGRIWSVFGYAAHQLLIISATAYWFLSNSDPHSFAVAPHGQPLTRIDAVYLAVTTFTTDSYGDIVPRSASSSTLILLQQVLGYTLITVVLVLLVSRTVQGSITSRQVRTARAGASSSSARARGILRSDRALMLGITVAWVWLIGSVGAHVQLTWLRWVSLAYALCIPMVAMLRIFRSIVNPRAAKIRVAYLFVMGAYTVFFAYWYAYLLTSNAYLSFSIGGVPRSLTSLESMAISEPFSS